MVKTEYDGRLAPHDERQVLVQGKAYHYKTKKMCTTCNHEDRPMYVKFLLNGRSDAVIECPVCESNLTTKTVLVPPAEPRQD